MKSIFFKNSIVLLLLQLVFVLSCTNSNDDNTYYYPADFDPSASTSFIWTTDFYEIIPQLAGVISSYDNVTLYIGEKEEIKGIHAVLEKYEANLKNIEFVKLENKPQNAWLRDYGPVYLINSRGKKKLVNFLYFGKKLIFNEQIAATRKLPVVNSSISSTGGSREVNGKGTMILCEVHELTENPSKTKQEIEEELKSNLELKKIIWLKQGIPQDDSQKNGPLVNQVWPNGVNGHVDEFVRFADSRTVLISSISEGEANSHPILAEARRRMDENYDILINAADQDGNKLNVVKVPFAPLVIDRDPKDNRRFLASVTSYMNFIVTNSLVVLPSYTELFNGDQKEDYLAREAEVEQIFKEAFPGKKIIKIQAAGLNRFSGGFHCVSLNEPLTER
jgi:agmatine deiminase